MQAEARARRQGTATSPGADFEILAAGTEELNRWINAHPGENLRLQKVALSDSNLSGALLKAADLSGAEFCNCTLRGATFDEALLRRTRFMNCDLRTTTFRSTDLSSVVMSNCALDGADFRGSGGFSQIALLATSTIQDRNSDVTFDLARCRWLDRVLPWSRIKNVGELRLFLPSYGALIISLFVLSLIAGSNEQMQALRDAAASLHDEGFTSEGIYLWVIKYVQPFRPSWRHFAVLGSTASLAVASTSYLFCPARVKEFTLDQWLFSADRPAFEYHVHTWSVPYVRITCALSYLIGGAIAIVLLADTVMRLALLLLRGFTV